MNVGLSPKKSWKERLQNVQKKDKFFKTKDKEVRANGEGKV